MPSKEFVGKPTEHYVTVRGIRLHYLDWGDTGPTMLMLHGDMRTSRSWDALVRSLRSNFHIICLNARGNGDSDWPETGYRFRDRMADLSAFCDALEIENTIGVGHSTGAVVMTLAARETPGRFNSLVLMEPMIVVGEEVQRMISRTDRPKRPRRTWVNKQELYEYLKQHPTTSRWREDVIHDIVNFETMDLPSGSIDMKWADATMSWMEREGDYVDLRPVFRNADIPMLYIVSGDRRKSFEDLDSLVSEIPDFHTITIDKTGHNMYMERPDAVSDAIKLFVNGEDLPSSI